MGLCEPNRVPTLVLNIQKTLVFVVARDLSNNKRKALEST